MKKNFTGKVIFIVAVLALFTAGMFLGPYSKWGSSWKAIKERGLTAGLANSINLGLDLKGGTHLILQVMVNDAVNAETERAVERLREDFRASNISFAEIAKPNADRPDQISIKGVAVEQAGQLRSMVGERYAEYDLQSGPENSWLLTVKPQQLAEIKRSAVTQAIETIRQRVDTLGVTEPVIQEHGLGEHQILVQLPGVDDPMRVKEIMQSTAMLEIRLSKGGPYASEAEALQANSGILPPDTVMLRGRTVGSPQESVYIVTRSSAVAGRDFRAATPIRDENGNPAIAFNLTLDAGRRFANFTSQHVGQPLAVVLDNRVREVANIQERIADQGRITGGFTQEQAADLAMMLRSGALPASIQYREERTVGPSLGVDSIRQGVWAGVVGLAAVVLFMIVYYRWSGVNANLALFLNLILLLGFMGFSGATLTLPGIAGVILTIGMAVDSNVLIFERIKEELKAGKATAAAIDQGFARAWLTIIDTHVTTIVSALILFIFGTGPVRGFAVTLSFGLLANIFTAVFVSRVIYEWVLGRKQRGEAISI